MTWLKGGEPLEADRVYDEALEDAGFEPRAGGDGDESEPGGGDDPSAEAAVAVLRRAGFGAATARAATLVHEFTPDRSWGSSPGSTTRTSSSARADEREALGRTCSRASERCRLKLVAPIVYAGHRARRT